MTEENLTTEQILNRIFIVNRASHQIRLADKSEDYIIQLSKKIHSSPQETVAEIERIFTNWSLEEQENSIVVNMHTKVIDAYCLLLEVLSQDSKEVLVNHLPPEESSFIVAMLAKGEPFELVEDMFFGVKYTR